MKLLINKQELDTLNAGVQSTQQLKVQAYKKYEQALTKAASEGNEEAKSKLKSIKKELRRSIRLLQRKKQNPKNIGESNLILLANAILDTNDSDEIEQSVEALDFKNRRPLSFINDSDVIQRAKTLLNLLSESYLTNPNGTAQYFRINPNTVEGLQALDFASSNAAQSLATSTAAAASIALPLTLISEIGVPATLITAGEGYLGDWLGRKVVGKFTTNPIWKTAGGSIGGAIGGYHSVGATQRLLESAMKMSANANPLETPWKLTKHLFINTPYTLIGKYPINHKYNGIGQLDALSGRNGDIVKAYIYNESPGNWAKVIDMDKLSSKMLTAILERYPNRPVRIFQTRGSSKIKLYDGEIPKNYKTATIEDDGKFWTLYSEGSQTINSAGHHFDYFTTPDGRTVVRNVDLWKFYPKDYGKKWGIKSLIGKLGLWFTDKTGHPMVFAEPWHYLDTRPALYLHDYEGMLDWKPRKRYTTISSEIKNYYKGQNKLTF